ncbi:LysE family transporter [Billgrantia diversa]|uniref:LysE family transporter n=1 Tax=Halomonas sp. MCCC 1A13316 TaxID=2733487 RepID=UPI001E2C137B|nr:LysE family transporter [Halomonas sp. MCCC 1A13316]
MALSLASTRVFPRHSHDQYGIGLIAAGGQRSWSGIGRVDAMAGDIITVFQLLKLLGVAYLLYIAWSVLRSRGIALPAIDQTPLPARRLINGGVLLNPKLTLFFFAFLPQFVNASEPSLMHMLELSLAFMLMTFSVFIVYGLSAAAARQRVLARPQVLAWLRRSFASGFLALAVRLAITER